jgi:hypothetical protein
MMRMGVWTENLSLPAVINECLLQSYDGVIRLFPNTAGLGPASFSGLRAAGAFLVGAKWDGQTVSGVSVQSEKGAPARVLNPWPGSTVMIESTNGKLQAKGDVLAFPTAPGTTYRISA